MYPVQGTGLLLVEKKLEAHLMTALLRSDNWVLVQVEGCKNIKEMREREGTSQREARPLLD